MPKTPEQIAREAIDRRLIDAGWVIQDMNKINLSAALGVAIREFPTSTGPVDYALFVAGKPVGVVEAKKDTEAQNITVVEGQSFRYANSTFKYLDDGYEIRFAYEATGTLTRFTDFHDIKYRSRSVFSFHQPETSLRQEVKLLLLFLRHFKYEKIIPLLHYSVKHGNIYHIKKRWDTPGEMNAHI